MAEKYPLPESNTTNRRLADPYYDKFKNLLFSNSKRDPGDWLPQGHLASEVNLTELSDIEKGITPKLRQQQAVAAAEAKYPELKKF